MCSVFAILGHSWFSVPSPVEYLKNNATQSVQLLNDVQMGEWCLLQANDGKILVSDGEKLVNDGEMSVWSYTHFTIIDEHFIIINKHITIIKEHFTIISLK